jgi:hypothetical protein
MGIFFEKPTKGPDAVGGLWPIRDTARVWNRSGSQLDLGDVVMFAFRQGVATEIATNDANSYLPGRSNDTIWNTVINPTTNAIARGALWAVVIDDVISDNKAGNVCTFGIVDAYVSRSNTTATVPGAPLTVFVSNGAARGNTFDPVILSNEAVVGTLISFSNAALTTKRLKKVFLHQGLLWQALGINGGVT